MNDVHPLLSAPNLSVFTNSNALALSNPLALLSQHCIGALLNIHSAILTRCLFPPDTPQMKSLPTLVWRVCVRPNMARTTSRM